MKSKMLKNTKAWLERIKAWGAAAWATLRLVARELGNTLTNVLVPIASVLCALAEALHLPPCAVVSLKRAEQLLFSACATADMINGYLGTLPSASETGGRGAGAV